jgi:hypothetical protein
MKALRAYVCRSESGVRQQKEARLGETKRPDDLMHEDEVYKKYPKLFADRELREARKAGLIRWYDLRKGPHYSDAQIMEYLDSQERTLCRLNAKLDQAKESPIVSSRSAPTGLAERRAATTSSIIGMTPLLEERAAKRLESET